MASVAWLVPGIMALSAVIIIFGGRYLPKKGAEIGIAAVSIALLVSLGVAADIWTGNVAVVHEAEEALHHGEGAEESHGEETGGEESHAEEGTGGGEAGEDDHGEEGAQFDGATVVQVAAGPDDVLLAAAGPEEGGEELAIPEGLEAEVVTAGVEIAPNGEDGGFTWGIRVDGLTAMMFILVTVVSLMVHIYSTGYLHGDPRFTWYFGLLSLFTMSMLVLVIADNIMQVLVGWELVGVCSFLLIGFWWEEHTNSSAAIKAFLTTKFGDIGLVVGVITLWAMFRTFDIGAMLDMAAAGEQAAGAALDEGLLTFGLLALFLGAVGKSAQFPLHIWLPDAMAGPTPVSALIHAATMVTAGVFLIARLYPLFQLSSTAKAVIAVVGAITLFAMGLLALVQDDVKRVLAYSTVSQLGYMMVGLAFSYTAGIFHLFTHGFFKALLFLGSGSLIHAVHSNNMSDMGGLRKVMPWTFWTFLIGSLALIAFPLTAGFWSKDEVLVGALGAGGYTGTLVLVLGALGGMVTAFYMTRVIWLVFFGEYRGAGHPHESPPSMKWPLVVLAVPALLIGFINLPFDFAHPVGFAAWTMPNLEYFLTHPAEFNLGLATAATLLMAVGVGVATLMYRSSPSPAEDPMLNLGIVTRVLQKKYWLDDLQVDLIARTLVRDKLSAASYWVNDHVIDRAVYLTGVAAARIGRATYGVDQRGIDGVVNGIGRGARWGGSKLRLAQSGNVQLYAGAMFVGVAVLAVVFAAA